MLFKLVAHIALLTLLIWSQSSSAIELTEQERAFIAQNPVIKVGGEMGWPPMEYVENGVYSGAALDFLNEIEASTGITFDVVTGHSWGDLMKLIRAKEIDLLPLMFRTEDRSREFQMTRPYLTIRHYVYMDGKQPLIRTMDDLAGKTIAIPSGYASIDLLTKNHPEVVILEVASVVDAMDAVLTGDADAVIENSASIAYFASSQRIVGLVPAFNVRFESNNMGMAIRSDWSILRDIVQKALSEIPKERVASIMVRRTGSEAVAKSFLTLQAEFTPKELHFLAQSSPVIACVNSNRMPMESASGDTPGGMASDYLAALASAMKVDFKIQSHLSWKSVREGMLSGECDIATLSQSAQLSDMSVQQTRPFIQAKLALISNFGGAFIDDLQDLSASTVGFVEGYVDVQTLRARYSSIYFVPFSSIDVALEALDAGQLDGIVDNLLSANYALQKRQGATLNINGIFSNESVNFGMAISSSKPLLASAVKKTVLAMPTALNTNIQRKWAAVSIDKQTDYTWMFRFLLAASVVVFFFTTRFLELRRHRAEIQQKNMTLREVNSKLEEQTDTALHMAYHDALTCLPNRASLIQQLDQAIKLSHRNSTPLAVLFVDLDRFKPVNDTLGHAVGDKLLQEVTRVLQSILRQTDWLFRVGGDEFVVVLTALSNSYSPAVVAQRIIDELNEPFRIGQSDINIGSSIGIALMPEDADELHSILKCADSAMYTAKQNGRNRYAYYKEEMSKRAARRVQIEAALRHSIKEQGFSLVFQPIVDLETLKVVKAEALIRWNHPELGQVPPDEFIPIAEDVGLIVDIGDRVLRRACKAIQEFMQENVEINSIAVNVSTVEFDTSDVPERFKRMLEKYSIKPEQIEIEITERHMLDPTQGAEAELQKLREFGHSISVDDFGTGYSSLSYMKQLPINVIKIDRSFISDIPHDQNDVAITQAIISLSHNLGYKVVAEGVETKEQMEYLIDKCSNYAQGYYFSRPVPAEEFASTVLEINQRLLGLSGAAAKLRVLTG